MMMSGMIGTLRKGKIALEGKGVGGGNVRYYKTLSQPPRFCSEPGSCKVRCLCHYVCCDQVGSPQSCWPVSKTSVCQSPWVGHRCQDLSAALRLSCQLERWAILPVTEKEQNGGAVLQWIFWCCCLGILSWKPFTQRLLVWLVTGNHHGNLLWSSIKCQVS